MTEHKRASKPNSTSDDARPQPPARLSLAALVNPRRILRRDFSSSETLRQSSFAPPPISDLKTTFPEGGSGWLVVLGAWCALFPSLGIMNTMGAFEEHISNHQLSDVDISTVGWIFSLYAFLTFGVGLFVGPVFDKYGPRWLVLPGSVLVVMSMDLVGYCSGQSILLLSLTTPC